jgi:hypothetical protein
VILGTALLLGARGPAPSVELKAAFQVRHDIGYPERPDATPNPGATVFLYVCNTGTGSVSAAGLSWNGRGIEAHMSGPAWQAVWWRLLPARLEPGAEGELALGLRAALAEPTVMTAVFSDGSQLACRVAPQEPPFRIGMLTFEPGLKRAFLVVERTASGAPLPDRVLVDGVPQAVMWLSRDYVANVRAGILAPARPFVRGRTYTVRVTGGRAVAGTAMRAFTGYTRFGTCGYAELARYADNGLNAYLNFRIMNRAALDQGVDLGVKCAVTLDLEAAPPPETIGHPGLYAYLVTDEPDCRDYAADTNRPMDLRIGTLAQPVARAVERCRAGDPATPVMITLDLTFVPRNYSLYGPLPDIVNSDCYPLNIGQPLSVIRERTASVRRAAAPRPFSFTFQSSWEEQSKVKEGWIGADRLRREGWRAFVDRDKVRGFGRAPVPAEVRVQMLYALGCGARALHAYTDATEAGPEGVCHSSADLPELWREVGVMVRTLRVVAPLIELAHPVDWARAETPKVWTRTLLCGDAGALVVAVNDDYTYNADGFAQKPARNVAFRFDDWPWLRGAAVFRCEDGNLVPVASKRQPGGLSWTEPELACGAVYAVFDRPARARELADAYAAERPQATEAGKALSPEGYLQGRRFTRDP